MKKLLLAALMCLSFWGLRAQTLDPNYIDGHLYFKFVDSYDFRIRVDEDTRIDPSEMKQYSSLFAEYGVTLITRPLYIFNDPFLERVIRLEFTQYRKIDQFIAALEALPEVEYAEKIPLPKLFYNDPLYSGSWGSSAGAYQWNLAMIDAEGAWAAQVASSDIKVAVVDGAVWGAHPDLNISSSNMCSYATGRAVTGSSAPPSSVSQTSTCSSNNFYNNNCPSYDWSHGTHCAGMVAAKNNNGIGISSIGGGDGTSGSGLTLMGVRAANDNDQLYYTSNGVSWAINNGANVISMSYGGTSSSTSDQRMFQTAYNNGIVLVAAAGNDGDGDNAINYPAGYSTVIGVASVNRGGKLSTFSEYNTGRADIAAPGGFYSTSESGVNNILSTTFCTNQWHRINNYTALNGQYYDGMQGTSMACPTVAGLCGLMLSAYPAMTPEQVKSCLQSTANPLATGSHQIDGNGYINAAEAVNCAKNLASSLRANPSSIVIASRGGSKTSTITASSSISAGWTASCDNDAFTISPTSGSGNGASTVMTISAEANGTGAQITGTITITQGSETIQISVKQSDQSDLCTSIDERFFAHDSANIRWTWYYYTNRYSFKYAQRIPNTMVGTVDSITFAESYMYYSGSVGGSVTFNIYADNNGVPGTVLASKTMTAAQVKALSETATQSGTTYYVKEDFGVALDSPVEVSGDFYIGIDMTSVTVGNTSNDDWGFLDLTNQDEQADYDNGLIYYSGGWYKPSDLFNGASYYDILASAHFCESSEPYVVVTPSTITATPLTDEHEVTVVANCDWTASSDCDWVIVSPTSGTDGSTVTLTTVENGSDERECTVTFTYEGGTTTVSVTQMAHQDGCNTAELYDWQHFGWFVNADTTDYELYEDSIFAGFNIAYDEDNNIDSGYYYGTNVILNTSAAANMVPVYGTAMVNGATFMYGRTGTGGSVTFKMWDKDMAVLASKTVNMSDLDYEAGYINVYSWTFDSPIEVSDTFYVGADFSTVSSGSFFYFYTNFWYARSSEGFINNGIIQLASTNWVNFYGTIGAFPDLCYNGSHANIDLAVNIMTADTSAVMSTLTLNAGETLAPIYLVSNWGEATYLDSTRIFITLDDADYMTSGIPATNLPSGYSIVMHDTIATMSELRAMGYNNGDVLNLCYRVTHTNDTYEWNEQDISDNTSCLAVTINCPPIVNTTTETACDSYTFGSVTYTESGNYSDTLTSANGCDSIVTLNLTINHGTFNSETVSQCTNYQWHGTNYTESGTHTYDYTTNGCASTDTLHLTIVGAPVVTVNGNTTITPGSTTTLTASGATTYVWKQNGMTVSTSNPFTTPALNNTTVYTVEGTTGECTGSTEVTVTVQSAPTTYSEVSEEACGSYTWTVSGQTYTESGDYDYTLAGENYLGGDSTITLHLTINTNPTITVSGVTTITSGQTTTLTASGASTYVWTSGGSTVSTSNPYTTPTLTSNTNYAVTGTDAHGCTGSTTVTVIVSSASTVYDTVWVSECNSYEWNGQTYTNSGYYTHAEGNNVHVLSLTIYQNPTIGVSGNTSIYTGQSTTLTASGATSYVWTSNGATVSTSNPYTTTALNSTTIYTVTGTDAHGCTGSTQVTVTVTSAPSSTGDTTAAACDSFTWYGQTYTQSGNYTHVTTNAYGGDSTITLHLTINLSSTREETLADCDVINWNGQSYTQSGTYTVNQVNAAGCPETVTLHLTVNQSTTESEQQVSCDSYDWSVSGQHYTQSGTYTYNGTNQWGCPRTVTLTLTINHSTSSEQTLTDCDVINWNGQSYTQSGTYTVNQVNAAGCPETVTLHLTVNQSTTEADQQESCDSYDWDVNGQHYTQSGTYTYNGTNQWGCPNTVTLTLTINHSEVNNIYDTVSAGRAYSNYGFYVPSSETGAAQPGDVIERSHTGLYTIHHCDSTVNLHLTVTEGGQGGGDGIDDVNGIAMKLYPNPASTMVDIDCEGISEVRVYDMAGRMVSEQTNLVGDKAQVDVAKFAEGIYVISVMTQNGTVVKQKIAVKH